MKTKNAFSVIMAAFPSPDICTGRTMEESAGSRSVPREIQKTFTTVVVPQAYVFPLVSLTKILIN